MSETEYETYEARRVGKAIPPAPGQKDLVDTMVSFAPNEHGGKQTKSVDLLKTNAQGETAWLTPSKHRAERTER